MKFLKNQNIQNPPQIMTVTQTLNIPDGTVSIVLDEKDDHIVEFTGIEDSAWMAGENPTAPGTLLLGHRLPAGVKVPYWILAGEKIAVKGDIQISW